MASQDISITFIGDSFVEGFSDPSYLGWIGRICQYTQEDNPNIELTSYNLGIRGETSSNILKRWEKEVASKLKDGDRNIVIFSFGVNDCIVLCGEQRVGFNQSVQNLEDILTSAKDKYDDILFVMPPPIDDDEINERIEKLITLYREVCNSLDIKYIDLFDMLKANFIWQTELSSNDGAHPRDKGYEAFAKLIYEHENWKVLYSK